MHACLGLQEVDSICGRASRPVDQNWHVLGHEPNAENSAVVHTVLRADAHTKTWGEGNQTPPEPYLPQLAKPQALPRSFEGAAILVRAQRSRHTRSCTVVLTGCTPCRWLQRSQVMMRMHHLVHPKACGSQLAALSQEEAIPPCLFHSQVKSSCRSMDTSNRFP